MIGTEFECPYCKDNIDTFYGKKDERYGPFFDLEKVQSERDLSADPKSTLKDKIELWYCLWCGKYFRAYYKLEKLTLLEEREQ